MFAVDSKTGLVLTSGELDREMRDRYLLTGKSCCNVITIGDVIVALDRLNRQAENSALAARVFTNL